MAEASGRARLRPADLMLGGKQGAKTRSPKLEHRVRTGTLLSICALGFVTACSGDGEALTAPSPSSTTVGAVTVSTDSAPTTTDSPLTALTTATTPPPRAVLGVELPSEPRVLYEWYPDGENTKSIIVSDELLTAPPDRVVPEADGAAVHSNWSHDGSMFTWEVLRSNDTSSVWIANSDGSDPIERAICQAEPCAEMSYPSFASGDVQLLVTRFDAADGGTWGPSHLVLVDLVTGRQTIIASTPDGTTAFYVSTMSPDGSKVAATLETYTDATENTRTGSQIVVVDTDPETTDAPVAVTDPALFAGYPRWHPIDDRILFASWDLHGFQGGEQSQLYTVAPDGSALTQITHVDYATTPRRPGEANWTPDGRRIIASIGVVSGGSVVDVKIAYVDPTTGEITESDASGAMPSLQP